MCQTVCLGISLKQIPLVFDRSKLAIEHATIQCIGISCIERAQRSVSTTAAFKPVQIKLLMHELEKKMLTKLNMIMKLLHAPAAAKLQGFQGNMLCSCAAACAVQPSSKEFRATCFI